MTTELKNISTQVLMTMIKAYSSYFKWKMTEAEKNECKISILLMQAEIDSRTQSKSPLTMARYTTLIQL